MTSVRPWAEAVNREAEARDVYLASQNQCALRSA